MKNPRWLLISIIASVMVLGSVATATTIFLKSSTQAHAAAAFPSSYFAPYAELGEGASLQSVTQTTGQKYYTLAFVISNGCRAEWGGSTPIDQTGSDLPTLVSDIQYIRNQGGDIIVSFGGAAGQELAQACTSVSSLQAQYQAVINQYSVKHLDFDIEGGEEGDSTTYTRRNTALAALQQANPGLTISFTLPSATNGLEGSSIGLLNNAVSHGVNFNVVNLMTMDYGSADSQMGQESINAANGLHGQLQSIFPTKTSSQLWSMVGITAMIGQNDSKGEIFSLSNASQVLSFAQTNKIGELSFWAVSRDNGSCAGSTQASDTCSGISQSSYAFTNAWKVFSSGTSTPPTPTTGSGGVGTGYYYIVNQYSGKALDDTDRSTTNGTTVQQWSLVTGQTNQEWSFIPADSGYYYIMNRFSGKVLDDTSWSTTNGTLIQQWDEVSGQANQEWSLQSAGTGIYYVVNRYSGKVLDDTDWSTTNGTKIQQWSLVSGQADQQWVLQAV